MDKTTERIESEAVIQARRTAHRRALKALDLLAGQTEILRGKLEAGREIDSDSAGRLLHSQAADATANLGILEGLKAR